MSSKLVKKGLKKANQANELLLRLKAAKEEFKANSERNTDKFIVPDNWVDFAQKVKIRSGGSVVPFIPYDYQIELVKIMQERSIVVAKTRQTGISETVVSFMLWRSCLSAGYLGVIISKTQADSSLLARRVKRMISSLNLKTTTENLSDIEILGAGRILFRSGKTTDAGRGVESVTDVFMDEIGFMPAAKEVFDSVGPSQQMIGEKARVFAVSTPNGKDGVPKGK